MLAGLGDAGGLASGERADGLGTRGAGGLLDVGRAGLGAGGEQVGCDPAGFRVAVEVLRARGSFPSWPRGGSVAAAWTAGGTEAVAAAIAAADREPNDRHLWAVVGDLVARLPAADPTAKALTAVQRNVVAIANLVSRDSSLGTALS